MGFPALWQSPLRGGEAIAVGSERRRIQGETLPGLETGILEDHVQMPLFCMWRRR